MELQSVVMLGAFAVPGRVIWLTSERFVEALSMQM